MKEKHFFRSCIAKLLCALVLLLTAMPSFAAESENLNANDFHIRRGFDPAWTKSLPSDERDWILVKGNPAGQRIRIPDLKIPGLPQHSFFSFAKNKTETFTFVTTVPVTAQQIQSIPLFGLYISQIGSNWEVYVNGTQVRSELHLSPEGSIEFDRSLSNFIIPVDVRLLHPGENILAFRIIGDPAFKLTGFYRPTGNRFGSFTELTRDGRMNQGFLIFFYLTLSLFAFMVFAWNRSEKYLLFYGLTTLFLSLYIFARSPFSYELIWDSSRVITLEFFSLFLIMPVIGAMFDYFIFSKLSLFTKIYGSAYILFALALLAVPLIVGFDILLVWQISAAVPIFFYPSMIFIRGVLPEYRKTAAELTAAGAQEKTKAFFQTLVSSYAGLLFIGFSVLELCAALDIVDAVIFSSGHLFTQYGVFAFTVSVGLIIMAKYNRMNRKMGKLNAELQEKIISINEAHKQLSLSEEKYRFLVDYSADYIFILNTDGTFISASNSLLKSMKIRQDEIVQRSFFDLLHSDGEERGIDFDLIIASFSEMISNRSKTRFKAKFHSAGAIADPKDFNVFLDYTSIDGNDFILGKAVHTGEDTLQEFFLTEHQKYRINNYLFSAEQMSRRIASHAEKYLSQGESNLLRISIREIIINAIEHGNLAVTYDEKTESMEHDRYFEFIKDRQNDPRYKNRHVDIEYSINETKIACKITDQGAGFDHKAMMSDRAAKANEESLTHGRGLTMADSFFNEVTFNTKGNQILLVKHLRPAENE